MLPIHACKEKLILGTLHINQFKGRPLYQVIEVPQKCMNVVIHPTPVIAVSLTSTLVIGFPQSCATQSACHAVVYIHVGHIQSVHLLFHSI